MGGGGAIAIENEKTETKKEQEQKIDNLLEETKNEKGEDLKFCRSVQESKIRIRLAQ